MTELVVGAIYIQRDSETLIPKWYVCEKVYEDHAIMETIDLAHPDRPRERELVWSYNTDLERLSVGLLNMKLGAVDRAIVELTEGLARAKEVRAMVSMAKFIPQG